LVRILGHHALVASIFLVAAMSQCAVKAARLDNPGGAGSASPRVPTLLVPPDSTPVGGEAASRIRCSLGSFLCGSRRADSPGEPATDAIASRRCGVSPHHGPFEPERTTDAARDCSRCTLAGAPSNPNPRRAAACARSPAVMAVDLNGCRQRWSHASCAFGTPIAKLSGCVPIGNR
jgi:hypothetical protein